MHAFLSFLLVFAFPIAVRAACYIPGPAFPTVDHVLNTTHYSGLPAKLEAVIADILKHPDGWTINTTSFALQVTTSEETIWDYFYTAPILGEYKDSDPAPVTGDTAFRIASISKSFTVYGVLLENGVSLDDPITKYIPELKEGHWPDGPKGAPKAALLPDWDRITIRSLASQLSGISREGKRQYTLLEGCDLI
jgi:CubicO group peptidase (beta-lactamase class C family)